MPDDRIPDILSATRNPMNEDDLWYGVEHSSGDHRTVGSHRAWCYQDIEWCYPDPDGYCRCCDQAVLPGPWVGLNPSTILKELRKAVLELPTDEDGRLIVRDSVVKLLEGTTDA